MYFSSKKNYQKNYQKDYINAYKSFFDDVDFFSLFLRIWHKFFVIKYSFFFLLLLINFRIIINVKRLIMRMWCNDENKSFNFILFISSLSLIYCVLYAFFISSSRRYISRINFSWMSCLFISRSTFNFFWIFFFVRKNTLTLIRKTYSNYNVCDDHNKFLQY
jgi:hypothetical protein